VKPLAITLGDPAGIGPEVVAKALSSCDVDAWVFGSRAWSPVMPERIRFVDVGGEGELRHGTLDARFGRVALDSIDAALEAVENGDCSALVTAPIHKQAIAAAGSPFPGHTELLAARAGLQTYGRDYAMYFDSPALRVVLLSVHLSLREALERITPQAVADLARLTSRELGRQLGAKPRIAAAGVNPHAGEGGMFGREEGAIADGIRAAVAEGLSVTGPHAPDTVFHAAAQGAHDVVLAMYHDQGLIAVKTLDFERSVNVTLGLPWLRVSVDHGTAFDIAGRGVADHRPMLNAIRYAASQGR
jgi:4-hydroxythreonine-4-phosphate dehydrogenase